MKLRDSLYLVTNIFFANIRCLMLETKFVTNKVGVLVTIIFYLSTKTYQVVIQGYSQDLISIIDIQTVKNFESLAVTSMLVTDVGDQMCW